MQGKTTRKKATAKTLQMATAPSKSGQQAAKSTEAPEPSKPSSVGEFMPKLERGDRGPAVLRVQALLNLYGRSSLKRDGMFLAQTEEAVREHQSDHQLPTSGKVDVKTWQHLLTSKL